MELLELIKGWAGVAALIGVTVYGIFKHVTDYKNGKEGVKQNKQHTEQEKLVTDEKALDLDSRRVKASEEVASEALEDMAEARRENLKLLESDYEKSKAIIEMQSEIKHIKAKLERIYEERSILCFFFCRKANVCPDKQPVFGPYQLDVATLETLKKIVYENQPKGN